MIELERKIQQLQKDVEDIKAQTNKAPLRMAPAPISTMVDLRWAVTTEDAPEDTKIKAKLYNNNGVVVDEEIDVYCNIFGTAFLDAVVPRLKSGRDIPVRKRPINNNGNIEYQWWCDWWFNRDKTCVC